MLNITHKDIAFEFAMWISPEFKVYLIRVSPNSSFSNELFGLTDIFQILLDVQVIWGTHY